MKIVVWAAMGGWTADGAGVYEAPVGIFLSAEEAHAALDAVDEKMRADPQVGKGYDFRAFPNYIIEIGVE
jgi:hypothetical protein